MDMAEEMNEVAANPINGNGREGSSSNIGTEITHHLNTRVEKKEEQILKIEASVFQVANYYMVFQGVILTAVVKGSSGGLECRLFWLPLCISAIGATLNFSTLIIISVKYKEALDELENRRSTLYKNMYPKPKSVPKDDVRKRKEQSERKRRRRNLVLVLSMILFSIFVILNLLATWIIPCRPF